MEDYLPLQFVSNLFQRAVKQFCALQQNLYLTRRFKFLIETSGRDRDECLFQHWNNVKYRKASKALISKQLRNIMSTLFVNADSIFFSDLDISQDFVNLLFCDEKPKKKSTADEELTFKNRSVFDLVKRITFLACRIDAGVCEWISKKFNSIETLCIHKCNFNNYPDSTFMPIAELYHFFNERKCSFFDSLRYMWIDSLDGNYVALNLDKIKSQEERDYIGQFLDLSDEEKVKGYTKCSKVTNESVANFWGKNDKYTDSLQRNFDDCAKMVPEHVILISLGLIDDFEKYRYSYYFYGRGRRDVSKFTMAAQLRLLGVLSGDSCDLTKVLGYEFEEGAYKFNKVDYPSIRSIFEQGFNCFNHKNHKPLDAAIIAVFYFDDEKMLKLLKAYGFDVYIEAEIGYVYYSLSNVLTEIYVSLAGQFSVVTPSFQKFLEYHREALQKIVSFQFLYNHYCSMTDMRIEMVEYIVEQGFAESDLYLKDFLQRNKALSSNTLEPANKKVKIDDSLPKL